MASRRQRRSQGAPRGQRGPSARPPAMPNTNNPPPRAPAQRVRIGKPPGEMATCRRYLARQAAGLLDDEVEG
jgi:hypothetical protein